MTHHAHQPQPPLDYAASYNLGDGDDADKVHDLETIITAGAIIVGCQEASDRRRLRRRLPRGWRWRGPRIVPGAAAVPILWDARRLRLLWFATLAAVARMWVGAMGAGPAFAKPKRLNLAVFEDRETGERIRVLNGHFLPSAGRHNLPDPERDARRWHYLRMAQVLARTIDRLAGPRGHRAVVVTLDANAESDFPLLAPVRRTGIVGWTPRRDRTEGGRAIDHVLGLAGDRRYLTLSSDHRAVLAPL